MKGSEHDHSRVLVPQHCWLYLICTLFSVILVLQLVIESTYVS
jgi:hypothetical protein